MLLKEEYALDPAETPAENRVWNFFEGRGVCVGKTELQVLELHQEKTQPRYDLASGHTNQIFNDGGGHSSRTKRIASLRKYAANVAALTRGSNASITGVEAYALITERIASYYSNAQGSRWSRFVSRGAFMRDLTDVMQGGALFGSEGVAVNINSTGLRNQFQDHSGIQLRHFTGGFVTGYKYGIAGYPLVDFYELGALVNLPGASNDFQWADIAIGAASVKLGDNFFWGNIPMSELGNKIRGTIGK